LPAGVNGHEGDLTDPEAVARSIRAAQPDECYHLAAQTFVAGHEFATVQANVTGTLAVLEALRNHAPQSRLFIAGSSEMFGDPPSCPQDESTPLRPRNVYGVTKAAAFHLMSVYRQQHGVFGCCGILYNHESPRRGVQFVTRKITRGVALIRRGQTRELRLGNLDAIRDWGHARDYVRAMWLMLQQDRPDDYVIATGKGRTVREFVQTAFRVAGLDWQEYVHVAPEFFRPAEATPLIGCADKARRQLGWAPETSFDDLVAEMVACDLNG
jgi:GDPmannose 4,6-dehydratase